MQIISDLMAELFGLHILPCLLLRWHCHPIVVVTNGTPRDCRSTINEARAEQHIRMIKHPLFQGHDDKLRVRKMGPNHVANVLRMTQIQSGINLIQDVPRCTDSSRMERNRVSKFTTWPRTQHAEIKTKKSRFWCLMVDLEFFWGVKQDAQHIKLPQYQFSSKSLNRNGGTSVLAWRAKVPRPGKVQEAIVVHHWALSGTASKLHGMQPVSSDKDTARMENTERWIQALISNPSVSSIPCGGSNFALVLGKSVPKMESKSCKHRLLWKWIWLSAYLPTELLPLMSLLTFFQVRLSVSVFFSSRSSCFNDVICPNRSHPLWIW